MNDNKYIVIGRDENGLGFYYTGRAGKAFISPVKEESFGYNSLEEARKRATNLNRMTGIHGIRFFAPTVENFSYWTEEQS